MCGAPGLAGKKPHYAHYVVDLGIRCDTSGHVLVHYPGFCLMVKLREQNTRWKSGNLLTSRIELATTTWIEEVRFSRALSLVKSVNLKNKRQVISEFHFHLRTLAND